MKRFFYIPTTLGLIFLVCSFATAETVAQNGCYFGVFKEGAPANMSIIKDMEKQVGKKFSSIMWYQDWSTPFYADICDRVIKKGAIPHIVWEPWLWKNRDTIKLDNIIAGEWDDHIKSWAKDIKEWGKPIFIRWGHEFNIQDYPWTLEKNGKDPKKYIAAYRHVKDIFDREGAKNAKFIWCPMRESWPPEKWNDMQAAYPGDKYVDWIGIDGYNWGTSQPWSQWQDFTELFRNIGREMWRKHPGKPLMIAEFASSPQGGDKAKWILDIAEQLKKMPYYKNLNWFNLQKEADWRIDDSPKSLEAFKKLISDNYFITPGNGLADITSIPSLITNRKKISAKYASLSPKIDADISEWSDAIPAIINDPTQIQEGSILWQGPKDLSGKIYLKWDNQSLYIAADITDNKPLVNNKKNKNLWNGDAVEFTIGLDKNVDQNRDAFAPKDYQIGFGTGNGTTTGPSVWNWTLKGSPEGYAIAVKKTQIGYIIESSIPWRSLGVNAPSYGDTIAFDCALDDADKDVRTVQMVWNGDFLFYKDPGVWGRLEFEK